jgi:hypothetical protein
MLRFSGHVKREFIDGINPTQDQVYIRALAVDFFTSLLNMVDGWASRTLAEIERWDDLSPEGKNERGMEIMRNIPVATPGKSVDAIAVPPPSQVRKRSTDD